MNRRLRAFDALPRPNRTTIQFLVLAALAIGALWFLVLTPAERRLADQRLELTGLETRIAARRHTLAAYERGEVLKGPALAQAVRPVETLLPDAAGSARPALAALEAAARSRRLRIDNLSISNRYTTPEKMTVSGVKLATGSMTVTGSVPAIESFMDGLDSFPQLVTYESSGLTVNTRLANASMQLRVSLWASTDPSWQNGRPLPPGATPTTTTVPLTATTPDGAAATGTPGTTGTTGGSADTPAPTTPTFSSGPVELDQPAAGALAAALGIIALVGIAGWLLSTVVLWRLFTKAGQRGWTALVPGLNLLVLLRVAWLPLWWVGLYILPALAPVLAGLLPSLGPLPVAVVLPLLGLLGSVIIPFRLAKMFGKGFLYGLGLLVLFPVFGPLLAFGRATYQAPQRPLF